MLMAMKKMVMPEVNRYVYDTIYIHDHRYNYLSMSHFLSTVEGKYLLTNLVAEHLHL